ncbi:MAG: hypothetical protein AAGC91_12475 [Pseudomonadota bacterium]
MRSIAGSVARMRDVWARRSPVAIRLSGAFRAIAPVRLDRGVRTATSRDGASWEATIRAGLLSSLISVLAACGGGGGGGGGGGFLPSDPGSDLTTFTLQLSLVDENGNPTTSVSETFPATLRVLVREDNFDAALVVGEVATAQADFATIAPANGQALTNAEGVAEFEIQAGATLGADTITVTVTSPRGAVTATIGVEVVSAGFQLGFFDGTTFVPGEVGLSSDSIAFRGTSVVRVAVVDETGATVPTTRLIRLSSQCSLSGIAGFRALGDTTDGTATLTVETVDGLASAEYVGGSCENSDRIDATLIDDTATASSTITIASRDANFIGFVSADPSEGEEATGRTIIALRGTGGPGRPEVATLIFEVLEEAVVLEAGDPGPGSPGYLELPGRAPIPGIEVSFGLVNTLGGITLGNTSGMTNAQGLVEVEVIAGNVATSTNVTATFDGGNGEMQTATSNQVVIGTGLPDQNSISISTEVFRVPSAANEDGIDVAITVRMADKFNNPVADGTSAVFTTEYGAIDSSCQTGLSNGARFQDIRGTTPPLRGTCTVLWISQAPRGPVFNNELIQTIEDDADYDCPSHTGSFGPCPDDLGEIRGLRSTITVTAVGEEFFIDANGNGIYDAGEVFENLPEAFTDHNEDGVYTPFVGPQCGLPTSAEDCAAAGSEEEFIDFNGDLQYSTNVDSSTGEGVYNGSLCPLEGDGVFCSRELLNVRTATVLTLTSFDGNLSVLAAGTRNVPFRARNNIMEGEGHVLFISDIFNNPPAARTVITVEPGGDCELLNANSGGLLQVSVPDSFFPGAFGLNVSVNGRGQGGNLTISAASPPTVDTEPVLENASVIGSLPCVTFCSTFAEDPNGDLTEECIE